MILNDLLGFCENEDLEVLVCSANDDEIIASFNINDSSDYEDLLYCEVDGYYIEFEANELVIWIL